MITKEHKYVATTNDYKVGERVGVKCVGTDVWAWGEVVGVTAKRIRVYNEVRGLVGLYNMENVEKYW
tara:strand:- start:429 stop:629 length:201 start_codon:yes stop_codon:yes gene_type:complete